MGAGRSRGQPEAAQGDALATGAEAAAWNGEPGGTERAVTFWSSGRRVAPVPTRSTSVLWLGVPVLLPSAFDGVVMQVTVWMVVIVQAGSRVPVPVPIGAGAGAGVGTGVEASAHVGQ